MSRQPTTILPRYRKSGRTPYIGMEDPNVVIYHLFLLDRMGGGISRIYVGFQWNSSPSSTQTNSLRNTLGWIICPSLRGLDLRSANILGCHPGRVTPSALWSLRSDLNCCELGLFVLNSCVLRMTGGPSTSFPILCEGEISSCMGVDRICKQSVHWFLFLGQWSPSEFTLLAIPCVADTVGISAFPAFASPAWETWGPAGNSPSPACCLDETIALKDMVLHGQNTFPSISEFFWSMQRNGGPPLYISLCASGVHRRPAKEPAVVLSYIYLMMELPDFVSLSDNLKVQGGREGKKQANGMSWISPFICGLNRFAGEQIIPPASKCKKAKKFPTHTTKGFGPIPNQIHPFQPTWFLLFCRWEHF